MMAPACLRRIAPCALIAGLLFCARSAGAAEASFAIPLGAMELGGNSTFSSQGVTLGNTGASTFFVNFMLPRDYKTNSPVSVILYLHPTTSCQARMLE